MIKLKPEFREIEIEINRELEMLERKINDVLQLEVEASEGTQPPPKTERRIRIHRDNSGKQLVIRDEGKHYKIDLTEL